MKILKNIFAQKQKQNPPKKELLKLEEVVNEPKIEQRLKAFKRDGKTLVESISMQGNYRESIDGIIDSLNSLADDAKEQCKSLINVGKSNYTNAIIALKAKRDQFPDNALSRRYWRDHAEERTREIAESRKPLLKIEGLESKAQHASDKKEEQESKRDNVKNEKYGGRVPEEGILRRMPYFLFGGSLVPTEASLIVGAIDSLATDLQAWAVYPIAITISILIIVTAHFTGSMIAKGASLITITIILLSGVTILAIVFWMRLNAPESALVMSAVNLVAFAVMSVFSYLRHKDDPYFDADRLAIKYASEEQELIREIADIEASVASQERSIDERYNALAEEYQESILEPLNSDLIELECDERLFESYLKYKVSDPIDTLLEKYQAELKQRYNRARRRKGLGTLNGHSSVKLGIIIPILFLGITSCSHDNDRNTENHVIQIVTDQSIEKRDTVYLPTLEDIRSWAFDDLGMLNSDRYVFQGGIEVIFTSIDDTSMPTSRKISLSRIENPWTIVKTNRRNEQKQFLDDFDKNINVAIQPRGLKKSHVVDCLCQSVRNVSNSKAINKRLLIVSDLLANSDVFNFYTAPPQEKDYVKIINEIKKRCPTWENSIIDDVAITAVYKPSRSNDQNLLKVRNFIAHLFKTKGVEVNFVPTI